MRIKLSWQKRAIVIFVSAILILSIILFILAIREAEREKLLIEREMVEEQQRCAALLLDQVDALLSDIEEGVGILLGDIQDQPDQANLKKTFQKTLEEERLLRELFWVEKNSKVIFPVREPLFLLASREFGNVAQSLPRLEGNSLFQRAEAYEFEQKDYAQAIDSYRKLMETAPDKSSRALLMNRIGRCYVKSGQPLKAVDVYRTIASQYSGEFSADGIPLGIIAHYQIGNIYAEKKRKKEEIAAFLDLYDDLLHARWPLTKSQFHFYLDKAKEGIEAGLGEMEAEEVADFKAQWEKLEQVEREQMQRMRQREDLVKEVIPLIDSRKSEASIKDRKFVRFSASVGKETYFVSFAQVNPDSLLGLSIDLEVLAQKNISPILERIPLRSDWQIQIVDEFGHVIVGNDIGDKSHPAPQLTYSEELGEYYPPWKINVYLKNPGSAEKQFNFRRNIYILTVAVVMAALLFGGFFAIRSTAKELELAKLKSEFVSTVSHEFRTPLTSIRYLADLLRRGRVRREERRQEYFETISSEGERLSRLIENILDFSKIEAGMKEYQFEKTDVAELVKNVDYRFKEHTKGKEYALKTEISDQMPVIPADEEAVSRALDNLLDNAIKYSGKKPKIILRAWSSERNIFMEVEDNGVGISKEDQKQVFKKFYRSNRLEERMVRGSGIGLTIVEHIVRAHRGEVLLESAIGKGTKVTIKLPIKREED
jgi:signal transduction histidine kinase